MGKVLIILALVAVILLLLKDKFQQNVAPNVSPGTLIALGQPTPPPPASVKPEVQAACSQAGAELVSYKESPGEIVEFVVRARSRPPLTDVLDVLVDMGIVYDVYYKDSKTSTTIEQSEPMNYMYHKIRAYK